MRSVNSDQHLALASVLVSGATAITAVVGSGIGGWRERAHQRAMADTDRKQQRLTDAYIGLLEFATDVSDELHNYFPMISVNANPDRTTYREDKTRQSTVLARVDAYGSAEVKKLTYSWQARVKEALAAAQDFSSGQVRSKNKDDVSYWYGAWRNGASVPLLAAEDAARKALKDKIAAEFN